MTPAVVHIGHFPDYNLEQLKGFIKKGLNRHTVPAGSPKVLVKPNLVMGKRPEKAVNTHPTVVRAVVEVLRDRGATIVIGDSPGYESTEKALKNALIWPIIEEYHLAVAYFSGAVAKPFQGLSPYREFILGEDPSSYDLIVNLPKLKTHAMMGLSLGVKNVFGFIRGLEKARWHLRAGADTGLFASVLVDLYNLVKPGLTILDGIVAMDGDGPTNGRPRSVGLMALSVNAFNLDREIEKLLGLHEPLPISLVAMKAHLIEAYEVLREGVEVIPALRFPSTMATDWSLPSTVKGILKNTFVRRPKATKRLCQGCGICSEVCRAGAIEMVEEMPVFDYKRCIRCYCCQEMCPQGAIKLR
jgi:uncharacterized protein (DUF362 family)/NAD-dependent dihydropyrimidine dehydrogenase PreA subunit